MSSRDPTFEDAIRDLGDFLSAIEPYLGRVVLGGGWAPAFYRHLPQAAVPAHGPLLTYDFDLVAPADLPSEGDGTLRELLLRGNFVDIRGREPPVVYYQHARWGTGDLAPVYGELLTPLIGSGEDRCGEPKYLAEVQDRVVAQQLRYLDLVLHDPVTVPVGQILGPGGPVDLSVRVPNPAAYILQKALALDRRKPAKQRKDLAYIFEVAAIWFHETDRVRRMVDSIAGQSRVWAKWVDRAGMVLRRAFESVDADGPISAAQVFGATADGHLVNERSVAHVTASFLEAVLGGA